MSQKKVVVDKDTGKIPSLSFRTPGASPSPRKPPASSRTAKSQRVLGQIKELNAKRPLLLKALADDRKIEIVCDWMSNAPPAKFGSWLYRFNVLLQSLQGLQAVVPEIRTLAGIALSRGCAILSVQKMANKYPHWGVFCATPELAENPSCARIMVMEGARIKSDNAQDEEDFDSPWVVVGTSDLDLVTVDPIERTALKAEEGIEILSSRDMGLIKAGMQLAFVSYMEQRLRKYSLQRYPCPDSAVNVVVRQGDIPFVNDVRRCIKLDIGIGTEHDAFQWSSRWMSEWQIVINLDAPTRAEIRAEISSDAYSLSYGALRMKQKRRIPTFVLDVNYAEVEPFTDSILGVIEKAETDTQVALQKWLCNWHEVQWRHISRDNTYASSEYGPLVMQRQDFASELQNAIKENLGL